MAGSVEAASAAGWRCCADKQLADAVRVTTAPTLHTRSLEDTVDLSSCVLLERSSGGQEAGPVSRVRPGFTLSVRSGHKLAISEISLLSEFRRCQLFGDHGEYLTTETAQLLESVEGTDVMSLHHRSPLPQTQLTLECVDPRDRDQLWLYGVQVTLVPALLRPAGSGVSLEAVLARMSALGVSLSPGAQELRSTLQATQPQFSDPASFLAVLSAAAGRQLPPAGRSDNQQLLGQPAGVSPAALPSLLSDAGAQTPADQSDNQKLPDRSPDVCGEPGAVPVAADQGKSPESPQAAWLEQLVTCCADRIEARLWQRIEPRLIAIESKQQEILDRTKGYASGAKD